MNEQDALAAYAAPLTTCPNCGNTVPEGEFCGACGMHLLLGADLASHRRHAYAADPGEHLFHLSVISTLLPHLPHRRNAPFRLALLAVGALLLILGLLRLTGPAIAAAAVSVPFLYLLYLYEVEVYEDQPLRVIATTLGIGLLLGIPWAFLSGPYITQTLVLNVGGGAGTASILTGGVLLPLVAQILMLVGPLILYSTSSFDEALDGFAFGAAAALGFVLSTTLVNLWPELSLGLVTSASATANTLHVLQRGLLIPLIHASTTGLMAGALWLRRGRIRAVGAHGWTTTLPTTILLAALVQIGLGLLDVLVTSAVLTVAAYAVAAGALLICVRIALHHMLLAEAVEVTIGPDGPCTHCGRIVPRMAFCPNCGIATRATPKTGGGRSGRLSR